MALQNLAWLETLVLWFMGFVWLVIGLLKHIGLLSQDQSSAQTVRLKQSVLWAALLAAASGFGFCRAQVCRQQLDRELSWKLEGKSRQASGRIAWITDQEKGSSLLLKDVQAAAGNATVYPNGLLVYLEKDWDLEPGMRIQLQGEIQAFSPSRNPGEFDSFLYYRSRNLSYRMFGKRLIEMDRQSSPYLRALYLFRKKCQAVLNQIADPHERGILSASLLGNRQELDSEIKNLYQRHGIAHLLAISGLHVSMIGMGIYAALRKTGLGYGAAGCIAGGLVVSYGILTGSSSSVARAVTMLLCGYGARFLGRTYDLPSAAALAAIGILWEAPYLVLQGGLQLSFGAVLALGILEKQLRLLFCCQRWYEKTLNAGISIQMITYPLILYHFFSFPIYGILLNFITVPLMSLVLISGILGITLGSVIPAAGVWALGGAHYILELYQWLCGLFELLPAWNLALGQPSVRRIFLYYGILAFTLGVVSWKVQIRKRSYCWHWVPLLAVVTFFLLWPAKIQGLKVTFLDVGQGDGIVMQTGRISILVDGGSSSEKKLGEYRLEPFLKSRGIGRLDYAVVSHGDLDHMSGLAYLLEEGSIPVKVLMLPELGRNEETIQGLASLAERRGSQIVYMKEGDYLQSGSFLMTCIYPSDRDPSGDKNEHSLVLRVDYGAFHMLLTGDMTKDGEKRILNRPGGAELVRPVQILKIAHHGSDTSTGSEWLEAMNVKWAVFSYGAGNSYGHPHQAVVERLNNRQAGMWETARTGAVTVQTDGKQVRWSTWLEKLSDMR